MFLSIHVSWFEESDKILIDHKEITLSLYAVPRELRAPEDFLKWRYNLLDMRAMRVAYYARMKIKVRFSSADCLDLVLRLIFFPDFWACPDFT